MLPLPILVFRFCVGAQFSLAILSARFSDGKKRDGVGPGKDKIEESLKKKLEIQLLELMPVKFSVFMDSFYIGYF